MHGKRFLAVVMSLCMLSAEASHCAPFITQRIAAHADSAETGSNSSGKVKSLTTRIGDVNGDGKVTEDDKTLLQKWLVQMVSDNELKLINADVNRDGNVDIMDLVDLSRLISHDPDYVYGSSDENTVDLESAELGAYSEIFSEINTDDNAFKVSMDITASSEALASLSASESEYSNVIKNDEIVAGVVPEFECEEGAVVDEVTLNFDIDPNVIGNNDSPYAAVSDDFNGIKRFNVFKYFDDIGMLLPIETKYTDTSITTTVDELGTYCIVDMEKWFETLGIEPEEFATVNTSVSPVGMLGVPLSVASLTSTKNTDVAPIDVVFHAYVDSGTKNNKLKATIKDAATILYDEYGRDGKVHIYVADYTGKIPVLNNGHKYAENEDELDALFDEIVGVSPNIPNYYSAGKACVGKYKSHFNNLMVNCKEQLRENADRYYVYVESRIPAYDANVKNQITDELSEKELTALIVSPNPDLDQLAKITWGQFFTGSYNYYYNFGKNAADFIKYNHGKVKYTTVLPTGWKRLALDAPITDDYKKVIDGNKNFDEGKITPTDHDKILENYNKRYHADTDNDGVVDLKEIRYTYNDKDIIEFDSYGYAILPTIEKIRKLEAGKAYVDNALSQYHFWEWGRIEDIRILPVKTDPTEKDSDFDDFTDKEDPEPMNYNTISIDDTLLDDSDSINGKNPTITPDDLDKMIGHVSANQTNVDSEDDSCKKNELIFTRTRKKDKTDGKFTLTPSRNSDFAFTITGTTETMPEGEYTTEDFNSTVKIFYKKKGVFKKEEKQVTPAEINPNDDGTEITYVFALEEDVEYSIYVNNPTNNHVGTYEIHVSEDNWVYAPYGAIKKASEELVNWQNDGYTLQEWFIPSNIMYELMVNQHYMKMKEDAQKEPDGKTEKERLEIAYKDLSGNYNKFMDDGKPHLIATIVDHSYYVTILQALQSLDNATDIDLSTLDLPNDTMTAMGYVLTSTDALGISSLSFLPTIATIPINIYNYMVESKKEELKDALIDGNLSISVKYEYHKSSTYSNLSFNCWDGHNMINKYEINHIYRREEAFPGSVSYYIDTGLIEQIRCEVTPFNTYADLVKQSLR